MWTSAHFAMGMAGGSAIASTLLLSRRWRGWWPGAQPVAMTLGGLWACVPDMPRLWREDFPSLPLASLIGSKEFERWLHSIGDVFFFHASMDLHRSETGREMALHGLIAIIALYAFASLVLMLKAYWQPRWSEPLLTPPPSPPADGAASAPYATRVLVSPVERR